MDAVVDTRRFGDRGDVYNGRALMTKGGLKKDDLFEKNGKFVSKKMSENAKTRNNFVKKTQVERPKSVETIVDAFEKLISPPSPTAALVPQPETKKKRTKKTQPL